MSIDKNDFMNRTEHDIDSVIQGGDGLKKEYTVRIHIQIDGEYHLWETLSEEQQQQIGIVLNDKALRTIGYIPIEETS